MSADAILSARGVGIAFGGVRAVEDVSFDVAPGEILSIIGPNGAGKTTLFNLVSGIYRPDRGEVALAGRTVTALPPEKLAAAGLSRTFQNLQVFFRMSAVENVMLGRHLREDRGILGHLLGIPATRRQNRETRERAMALLQRLNLAHLADRPAGSLPYGVLKRLEIARALASEPKVLLLDEPAAGCNPTETAEIDHLIVEVARSGIAVVLVEHDMKLVMAISDRVHVMAQGRTLMEARRRTSPSTPASSRPISELVCPRWGPPMLELADLRSAYGRIEVLHGVSLAVGKGEIVTLIGANGAGKTTLLRTISGVQPTTGGTLRYKGADVTRLSAHGRVAEGVIQVPEGRQVFKALSVEDNLKLGAYRRRGNPAVDMERIYDLFPILREKRRLAAGGLSGGQQQMLAMGRAIMGAPELLLLDEPSMGLAPVIVAQIFDVIRRLKAEGVTIFLVEQNAAAALAIADRAFVMETGRITLGGTGRELAADEAVRRAYLGV